MSKAILTREPDGVVEKHDWGRVRWIVSGEQGNSNELTLGTCHLLPDCNTYEHKHPNCEEVIHVLTGIVRHHVAGEEEFVETGAGDTLVIPPGVQHQMENVSNEVAEMVLVFSSPQREVYSE